VISPTITTVGALARYRRAVMVGDERRGRSLDDLEARRQAPAKYQRSSMNGFVHRQARVIQRPAGIYPSGKTAGGMQPPTPIASPIGRRPSPGRHRLQLARETA